LPVAYVHVIFILPKELRRLARENKKEIYNLLMRSSWQTIKELSEMKENVGALPGIISVLHTFGSDVKYHVHTHNLVTFGGYDKWTCKWKSPKRKNKLVSYRKMSANYKRTF
jgi:diadenosine tetraphosphate (Ap4A) HIT family hydrolase